MDKQTPGQLFLSIFLRAAVAILGVVIIVFGIYFLTKFLKNDSDDEKSASTTQDPNVITQVEPHDDLLFSSKSTTEDASTTEKTSSTTEEPTVADSKDKNILVLNSTEQIGLAGSWCVFLSDKGYANTTASDYATQLTSTKIVAQKDGDGKDLINYFNNALYEVGLVTEGVDFNTSDYDIVIIIGTNDATETASDSDAE